ncbi:MAG: sensor histidine kinase [Flavobacteriales bacterium]|nr:sensor histidine kinase [Flavobacteriales bacterium]
MNIFKVPKTNYNNHYDRSRFKLLWNLSVVFSALMLGVSAMNLSNPNYSSIPNLVVIGMAFVSLFVLYKTREYKIMSYVAVLVNFISISITFFALKNVIHYTTPLWMITNILFAFFMLGKRWGISILVAHFSVACAYLSFRLESNIENLPAFKPRDIWNYIIEYVICGAGIGYIVYQFVNNTSIAEKQFIASNTELKEQNKIVRVQNKEKEVMLKEIHHRVKNNLQVITSLLRLQSYELEGEKGAKEFSESINRVKAMALIHEKMYQSELSNLDVAEFLTTLANDLIDTYSLHTPIKLDIYSDLTSVSSKTLVPLAILFNELISNSIKHAFIGKSSGEISVRISTRTDKIFTVKYADNGVWKEPNKKNSFSTELILLMTEQLDGSSTLEKTKSGSQYHFSLGNIEDDK